ncbi:MAG TPA: hypothetical protein VK210_08515, partial [Terriglobia bacterium]|nr:hypothetical protein [Terriglobia bacterium]
MSCKYSEERLARWMDSSEADLPVAEVREMNRHLASCTPCRETTARLRESQTFSRMLRVDAVNSDVVNHVHQRVMDQVADLRRAPSWVIQVERSLFFGVRRKYVLAGFGSLVLACGVALGILWTVYRHVETTVQIPRGAVPFVAAVSERVIVSPPAGN